ncbi:uncharacterized protein LOC134851255 [Symsagittifera roscoffensis]|uniref:uncharacterized protein LOC134851255 n=1 Tax=Symsagittifera roscoffensis TaxID=84072 RepID=UPI00307CB522
MTIDSAQKGSASLAANTSGPTRIAYYKISNLEKDAFWLRFRAFVQAIGHEVDLFPSLMGHSKNVAKSSEVFSKPETLRWNGGQSFAVIDKSKRCTDEQIWQPEVLSIDEVHHFTPPMQSENVYVNTLKSFLFKLFADKDVINFLSLMSMIDPFSEQFCEIVVTRESINDEPSRGLDLVAQLKKLKYFLNLPIGQVLQLLSQLSTQIVICDSSFRQKSNSNWVFVFASFVSGLYRSDNEFAKSVLKTQFKTWIASHSEPALFGYKALQGKLEKADPHSIFPTSIYRRCDGRTFASSDAQTIEAVMDTVLTTTIKITRNVLDPKTNHLLADVYRPLGRVVVIVDERVDDNGYSDTIRNYFAHFNIDATILVFGGDEIHKDMSTVQKMLIALKHNNVSRNQPVLVVGGGVISDTAGLACSLYHRNTPYVMLATSIVSGIDAGPSPRTCCDGFGYKNLYGAYHPPVLTLTDRMFWKSLKTGWARHGIAEIVKMACVKDVRAFELLEKAGNILVKTKFGTEMTSNEYSRTKLEADLEKHGFADEHEFQDTCDEIVGRAMEGYVRSEYGNLWETHQARPHAYGHTWSPGYELPAGMLHGHAVATCMGFGAFLARYHDECQEMDGEHRPWISDSDLMRILNLISDLELTLYHPIMDKVDIIWASQLKMTAKRGGNLAAPVPKGEIGKCGYITTVDEECLHRSLQAYKEFITGVDQNNKPRFVRNGFGVEMHCHDVGLQDPSTVIQPGDLQVEIKPTKNTGKKPAPQPERKPAVEQNNQKSSQPSSYQEWIAQMQTKRHKNSSKAINEQFHESSSEYGPSFLEENTPPSFPYFHLFADDTAEKYALNQTTSCSDNLRIAAQITDKESLFLPCMVGALESQFLKMIASISNCKRVLDVGTFTGMSAISFAETGAEVVTLEFDEKIAKVAQTIFDKIDNVVGRRITLKVGCANQTMKNMAAKGEKFDLIFLDADKDNYETYYQIAMDGELLADGGSILADNSACALLYDENDERRNALHRFNRKVANDDRVEQVLLTIREGVTMIRRKRDMMVNAASSADSAEKTENQNVQILEDISS